MPVNPLRHMEVFDPRSFGRRRVDVIGVGATGSHVVVSLAKLGVDNIHVWDPDKVESHNVANQAFGNGDIGSPKVEALARIVKALTGDEIATHCERVTGDTQGLGDLVFLLVDSMKTRREIFEGALQSNLTTQLLIETRMGADSGRIYSFNPNVPAEVDRWLKTLYEDRPVTTTACGASTTVGPTAQIIANFAVWQMIRWFKAVDAKQGLELEHELIVSLRPPQLMV